MKKINAVIVEDEVNSLNVLKNQLSKYCEGVTVMGEARNIAEGLKILNDPKQNIDVAFLDINLPDGLVFQLLDQLKKISFNIIFVTAYEKFAIKACNYASIGYILKPVDPDNLIEAVGRIKAGKVENIEERLDLFRTKYFNPNAYEKIIVSALDGMYFIKIKEIIRCEAEDNYTHIHLVNGDKITASKTIKSFDEMLSGVNFYRVHKSELINLNYMKKFVKGDGGYLVMEDGREIMVSRRRRPAFMEQMKKMQLGG